MNPMTRILAAVLLAAPLAFAAEPDPDAIPTRGAVAPAFGLHLLNGAEAEDRNRPVVELDDLCGMRPEDTTAVLLAFVDESHAADLSLANTWHRKHNKDGLEILAISMAREPDSLTDEANKAGLRYDLLDDRHRIVARRYGITTAPFSLLLDNRCRVLGMSNRTLTADQDSLAASIAAQVKGQLGQLGQ